MPLTYLEGTSLEGRSGMTILLWVAQADPNMIYT